MSDLGGGENPRKHIYTRRFAGAALGALIAAVLASVALPYFFPEKTAALSEISGIVTTGIITLGGIVGWYFGVTNVWPRK